MAVQTCVVCSSYPEACDDECRARDHQFEIPPSRNRLRRCPPCVAKGLAVCGACGALVVKTPGRTGRALCDECRQAGRRGTARTRVERVDVTCRGPEQLTAPTSTGRRRIKLPWKVPRHRRCVGTRSCTPGKLKKLTRYDSERATTVCRVCSGLEQSISLWLPRVKQAGYRPSTYDEYVRLQKKVAKKHLEGESRWRPNGSIGSAADGRAKNAARTIRGRKRQADAARQWGLIETWLPASERRHHLGQTTFEIAQCEWCGKLLMRSTSPTANATRFHRSCFDAYLVDRSEKKASLLAAGIEERKIPKILEGAPFSKSCLRPANLTRNFGWAIRYHVRGELQHDLADEGHVTIPAISQGVKQVLELLPEIDLVDQRFRPYVALLMGALVRGPGARMAA